jgi:hypothetical protein
MTLIPPIDPSSSVLLDTEPQRDPVVEAPRVGAAVDPITRIAEALASGKITGDEAVRSSTPTAGPATFPTSRSSSASWP